MVKALPGTWILSNTLSKARFCPPVAAKTSRLVMTWAPLIEALKTRCPAAVQ